MIEELDYKSEKSWRQILILIGGIGVLRYYAHNGITIYILGLNKFYEIYRIKKFLFRVCFCIHDCSRGEAEKILYYNLPYPIFLGKIL